MPSTTRFTSDEHQRRLYKALHISSPYQGRGYTTAESIEQLIELGFDRTKVQLPAMLAPTFDVRGNPRGVQVICDKPRPLSAGRCPRTIDPAAYEGVINVHPTYRESIVGSSSPLVITDNPLDADAASTHGIRTVSISWPAGGWDRNSFWDGLSWKSRDVLIVFEPFTGIDTKIRRAVFQVAAALRQRGALVTVKSLPLDDNFRCISLEKLVIGGARRADLERLPEVTARSVAAPSEESSEGVIYEMTRDGTFRIQLDGDKTDRRQLANFTARITGAECIEDGLNEHLQYVIAAEGDLLKNEIRVKHDVFAEMGWVSELGPRAIVRSFNQAGQQLREAIQLASDGYEKRRVIRHLGWVRHEGEDYFATAEGLIGPKFSTLDRSPNDGSGTAECIEIPEGNQIPGGSCPICPIPSVDKFAGLLDDVDSRGETAAASIGELPATDASDDAPRRPPEVELVVDIPPSLGLYRIGKKPSVKELAACTMTVHDTLLATFTPELAIPLLGAVFRAACGPVDFGIHLHGATNRGKTIVATTMLYFFGTEFGQRQGGFSWGDTPNFLVALMAAARNCAVVIDDWVLQGNRAGMSKMFQQADQVFRAMGNQVGRGRCNRDGTIRPGQAPQCLIISTGEQAIEGESLRSRAIVLEVKEGAVAHGQNWKNIDRLKHYGELGHMSAIMHSYLSTLANDPAIREMVIDFAEDCRTEGTFRGKGILPRSVSNACEIFAGYQAYLYHAELLGGIDDDDRTKLNDKAEDIIREMLNGQCELTKEADPAETFLRLLREGLASGQAHLEPCDDTYTPKSPAMYGLKKEEWTEVVPADRRPERLGSSDGISAAENQSPPAAIDNDDVDKDQRILRHRLKRNGLRVGWFEDGIIHLLITPALQVVHRIAEQSSHQPLPLTERTLGAALDRIQALNRPGGNESRYTSRLNVDGKQIRVLSMKDETLFPDFTWEPTQPRNMDFMPLLEA
jgi:hypothetical protein